MALILLSLPAWCTSCNCPVESESLNVTAIIILRKGPPVQNIMSPRISTQITNVLEGIRRGFRRAGGDFIGWLSRLTAHKSRHLLIAMIDNERWRGKQLAVITRELIDWTRGWVIEGNNNPRQPWILG